MDSRIIFLVVAAVVVSGLTAEVLFGHTLRDWNGTSSRATSERIVLKLSEPRPAPPPVEQQVEQPVDETVNSEAFTDTDGALAERPLEEQPSAGQ